MLAQDGDLLLRAKKTSVIIVHRGLFFQASSSLASAHDFPIPSEAGHSEIYVGSGICPSRLPHHMEAVMGSKAGGLRPHPEKFVGAHESTAALRMPEESSRVRALYAHSQDLRWIGRSKNSSIAS
jgi:hypothetical protein